MSKGHAHGYPGRAPADAQSILQKGQLFGQGMAFVASLVPQVGQNFPGAVRRFGAAGAVLDVAHVIKGTAGHGGDAGRHHVAHPLLTRVQIAPCLNLQSETRVEASKDHISINGGLQPVEEGSNRT